MDVAFHQFCRQHNIVDENNLCRQSEAARLLLFIAILKQAPNRIQSTVESAIRSAKPMLVAQMAKRLTLIFRTTNVKNTVKTGAHESTGKLKLVLGDWLYKSLQGYERQYRRPDGIVDDLSLVADVLSAGLQDPDRDRIASLYSRRVESMRRSIQSIEAGTRARLLRHIGEEVPLEQLARSA